jgi:hypothetical protein
VIDLDEMASRYIQTSVSSDTFRRLKVEAIDREVPLYDLLRIIVEEWIESLEE